MLMKVLIKSLLLAIFIVFSLVRFSIGQTAISGSTDKPGEGQSEISKCGVPAVLQSLQAYNSTQSPRPDFSFLLTREPTQEFYDTPEGHFRIHYDTSGSQAVYQPEVDVDPADGVPDYVNRCAEYCEQAWTLFDTLGYSMPPSDGENGGGEGLYDFYMHHYSGAYGVTFPENQSNQYPDRPNCYTSYIEVDPNYNGFGYSDRTLPLRVTVVHEFFHAVQFSYNVWASAWFMENCSTWSEDVLFDDVNDNYAYLPYFYNSPHLAHSTENGAHEYGMFVWPQFIFQNFGMSAIRSVWERSIYDVTDDALDYYFNDQGTSLRDVYRNFMTWNYFTGSRDDGMHFEEGSNYPRVAVMRTHDSLPVENQTSSRRPSGMGSDYIVFNNLSEYTTGRLAFNIDGEDNMDWSMDAIIFLQNSDVRYESTLCDARGIGTLMVSTAEPVESVTLIVTLLSYYTNQNFQYSAYIDTTTSVDDNPETVPTDFLLTGNYPNPFNSATVIRFYSPLSTPASFEIYDLAGRRIYNEPENLQVGENNISWDGAGFPSGIYYYKIQCQGHKYFGKMTLLK